MRRLRPKFISGSDRSSSAMTSAAASQLLCSTDRRSNWHRYSVRSGTADSDDKYRQMLANGRHTFSISLFNSRPVSRLSDKFTAGLAQIAA